MKLIWFNTKRVGRDTEWEFGCAWLFFAILAAVITGIVFLVQWIA